MSTSACARRPVKQDIDENRLSKQERIALRDCQGKLIVHVVDMSTVLKKTPRTNWDLHIVSFLLMPVLDILVLELSLFNVSFRSKKSFV